MTTQLNVSGEDHLVSENECNHKGVVKIMHNPSNESNIIDAELVRWQGYSLIISSK